MDAVFFTFVSFVQFSSGWRHCGMGFYGNLSFFLAEWGLLRAGFAEIVLLHEAWPTASKFRRDRSSRFYYLQHFAGKCGICMPEVIGTQWLFCTFFRCAHFLFRAVKAKRAAVGRADSLKACNLQQGTFFLRDCSACVSCSPAHGFFLGSNLLYVLLWPPRCRSEFFFLAILSRHEFNRSQRCAFSCL